MRCPYELKAKQGRKDTNLKQRSRRPPKHLCGSCVCGTPRRNLRLLIERPASAQGQPMMHIKSRWQMFLIVNVSAPETCLDVATYGGP